MDDALSSEMKVVAHEVAQKILRQEKRGVVEIGNSLGVVSRSEPVNIWKYKAVHRFKEEQEIFFIIKEQKL